MIFENDYQNPYEFICFLNMMIRILMNSYGCWTWWSESLWIHMICWKENSPKLVNKHRQLRTTVKIRGSSEIEGLFAIVHVMIWDFPNNPNMWLNYLFHALQKSRNTASDPSNKYFHHILNQTTYSKLRVCIILTKNNILTQHIDLIACWGYSKEIMVLPSSNIFYSSADGASKTSLAICNSQRWETKAHM